MNKVFASVKGWLPFVAIGVAILFILGLFKGVKGLLSSDKGKEEQLDHVNKTPAPNTGNMSFDLAHADSLADSLYRAFHQYGFLPLDADGTDEAAIFAAFNQIKTRDDMRAVYKAYGVRVYEKGVVTTNSYDLITTLKKELSSSDYAKIAYKINWL